MTAPHARSSMSLPIDYVSLPRLAMVAAVIRTAHSVGLRGRFTRDTRVRVARTARLTLLGSCRTRNDFLRDHLRAFFHVPDPHALSCLHVGKQRRVVYLERELLMS